MTAKKPNRAKAQHYVPRLHLKHFTGATPKNKVWTYSKSRETVRPSRIEETGHQTNYYSVVDESGAYRDDIDLLLQDIETKAAAPYGKLLAGEQPQGQERADFAVFVATCFSRSPAFIRSYAEGVARKMQLELRLNAQDKKSFDRLLDRMEASTGERVESREEAFAFLNDPSRYTLGISEKRGLQAIAVADTLTPIFYDRHWNVLEAVGERFITSDNPVFRWVPRETVHSFYGDGGFKNPRAEVTFPLSGKMMLMIGGEAELSEPIRIDANNVWHLNRMRAWNAEDLLFAEREDDRVTALALEFKDKRPRMTIGHEFAQDVEVNVTR